MVTKPSPPHDCVGFREQRGISQLQDCSRRHIGFVELGAPAVHGARFSRTRHSPQRGSRKKEPWQLPLPAKALDQAASRS